MVTIFLLFFLKVKHYKGESKTINCVRGLMVYLLVRERMCCVDDTTPTIECIWQGTLKNFDFNLSLNSLFMFIRVDYPIYSAKSHDLLCDSDFALKGLSLISKHEIFICFVNKIYGDEYNCNKNKYLCGFPVYLLLPLYTMKRNEERNKSEN